jgi:hypothetical protein
MKVLLGAIAVLILMVGAQSAYAVKPYWTPYSSDVPLGMTAYHIFLDGTYPSYVERNVKLLNQNPSDDG